MADPKTGMNTAEGFRKVLTSLYLDRYARSFGFTSDTRRGVPPLGCSLAPLAGSGTL